jgi:hypothetical protein
MPVERGAQPAAQPRARDGYFYGELAPQRTDSIHRLVAHAAGGVHQLLMLTRDPGSTPRRPRNRFDPLQREGTLREHQRGRRRGTRGHSPSGDSFFLHGFRARALPVLPAVPASLLHGKEWVDGSSPSEGFPESPANWRFQLPVRRTCGHIADTSVVLATHRDVARRPATQLRRVLPDTNDEIFPADWGSSLPE